jgi:hypothetical protein
LTTSVRRTLASAPRAVDCRLVVGGADAPLWPLDQPVVAAQRRRRPRSRSRPRQGRPSHLTGRRSRAVGSLPRLPENAAGLVEHRGQHGQRARIGESEVLALPILGSYALASWSRHDPACRPTSWPPRRSRRATRADPPFHWRSASPPPSRVTSSPRLHLFLRPLERGDAQSRTGRLADRTAAARLDVTVA